MNIIKKQLIKNYLLMSSNEEKGDELPKYQRKNTY